jgi:hypothetical protein
VPSGFGSELQSCKGRRVVFFHLRHHRRSNRANFVRAEEEDGFSLSPCGLEHCMFLDSTAVRKGLSPRSEREGQDWPANSVRGNGHVFWLSLLGFIQAPSFVSL